MDNALRKTIRVSTRGRITIPADVRERLGMPAGGEIILTVEGDHATIMGLNAARRRAQEMVRKYIKPGTSLSEELMAERKKESNSIG